MLVKIQDQDIYINPKNIDYVKIIQYQDGWKAEIWLNQRNLPFRSDVFPSLNECENFISSISEFI
jgi:hypothetical protein